MRNVAWALLVLVACSDPTPPAPSFHAPVSRQGRDVAVLEMRDLGEIRIELLSDVAPESVASFVNLAESGFYDGTTFHRVVPGFVIQGGDPNSRDRDPRNDGRGGPGYKLADEIADVAHVRGVVSLANSGRPDSAGSQFFIVLEDSPNLDGLYTSIGLVTEGMAVVDRIARLPRDEHGRHGPPDRPLEDVVIERIAILQSPDANAPTPSS